MSSAQQTFDFGDSDNRAVHGMLDSFVRVSPVIDPLVGALDSGHKKKANQAKIVVDSRKWLCETVPR